MSDYPTGGGFNYDFWNQYLDLDDEELLPLILLPLILLPLVQPPIPML